MGEHLARTNADERARREKELHKKVQLRLENKRRFEDDALDKASIPMSKVEVQGNTCRETVSLVDVRTLQSRCLFLEEGTHDVKAMLNTQRRQEEQRRHAAAVTKTMQLSSSVPELGSVNRRSHVRQRHGSRWTGSRR